MYLSIQQDICDIYDQNNMTEINSFAIYPWQKQSVYGTCQEIILPTTWKKIPSGWVTPEIILLNDLKTPQKWRLAFPGPLSGFVFYFYTRHMLIFKSQSVSDSFNTYSSAPGADHGATRRRSIN